MTKEQKKELGLKKKYLYDGCGWDSKEEIYFYWWCEEAIMKNYIFTIQPQPSSYILFDNNSMLKEHIYTPDFFVRFSPSSRNIFYGDDCFFNAQKEKIEVKPNHDRNNMTRLFSINQKWVYDKFNTYIQKVIVFPKVDKEGKCTPRKTLFTETFVPERFLLTDTGKQPRKINFKYKLLDEFLECHKKEGK